MTHSDEALIEAAKRGDTQAMNALLARHEAQVYRFGLRLCGSEEEAREVLQRTLVSAFRGIHAFRGEAALSTWLFQVARMHCMRLRRRRSGEPTGFASTDEEEARSVAAGQADEPEAVVHARQIGEALHAALLALPPVFREAVLLKDVEGLSAPEAARVVGLEVAAFKSRLHRARLALRLHLATMLADAAESGQGGCPALARELAAFESREIDKATCDRIEEHLARCEHCSETEGPLHRSVSLCQDMPGDEVPPAVRAAVRLALARMGHIPDA